MINNASKFAYGLVGLAVLRLIAALFYGFDDRVSLILFVALLAAGAAVAFGIGGAVGPDLAPVATDAGASSATDPADSPRSSYAPLVVAAAGFLLAVGGALGSSYVIAAAVVGVAGVALWLYDTFKPVLDPRDARNVDTRLLGPLALPVFGFVVAISVAYAFSRVLLAVSETASWVIAFIVAAVLLLILTFIAQRVPTTKAIAAITGVGVFATLVAGGAGAGVGEREFHQHEAEHPVVEVLARNTQFDRKVIGLPANRLVEMIFTNLDIDVYHNVGIYTAEEPGKPVFNGKPIAKGREVYRFKTPDAGTYRYICDFHPTMVGELRVEASTGEHKAEGTDH